MPPPKFTGGCPSSPECWGAGPGTFTATPQKQQRYCDCPFFDSMHLQIAIFLAGISLAGMAGLEEFQEVSENLPNPLIDAGIVGGAFYFWVEEVSNFLEALIQKLPLEDGVGK